MEIPKETWVSESMELKQTPDKGKGFFAIQPITEGQDLIIWGGGYVNKEEAEKAKLEGKLVMQWDEDIFSVEDRGEDKGYYINHSCDPNTWMKDSFTISAKRNIEVGEEVTLDYAVLPNGDDHVSSWECKCGSKNCRKNITGKDYQIKELQEKYKDHFAPILNKLIKNNNK